MADVFVEIRLVVLTSLLSLVVMFVFTRIRKPGGTTEA